jgi:O-antigen/teichoic acid export membrane protein
MVRLADPGCSLDLRLTSWRCIRELSRFSAFAFLNGLGELMRFYAHSVVIGRTLSVESVTPFSVAARLLYLFRQIIVAVASPLMAGMSALDSQGRDEELRRLFLRASSVTATCSLLLAAHMLLNGWSLIRYLRDALARPIMVCTIFLGCASVVTGGRPSAGVVHFAWTVLWETALFALLAYLFVLTASERGRLLVRLRGFRWGTR